MNIRKKILQTAGAGALMMSVGVAQAALVNGGFETDDASGGNVGGATGWTTFEPVFTYNTADLNGNFGPVSHADNAGTVGAGVNGLKMFGPFNGTGSAGGAFQYDNSVDGSGTQAYELSAWAMNWAPDALQNLGILQMTFWSGPDGTGSNLGVVETFASADGTQPYTLAPQDGADVSDWTRMAVTGVAPAGTQSIQAFLLNIQTGDPCCNGGSLFWDDVQLNAVPVPAAVWLFGSGLLGLVGVARRRKG